MTAKGGLVEDEYVDWVISRPYIYLVLLNLVGVARGSGVTSTARKMRS